MCRARSAAVVAYGACMTGQPLPLYIPQDVDMTMVKAQVAATGVSAPPADMPGLLDVVNQARADGITLKIVLLDHNPPNDTPLRDISTVVGADYPDATVLTLSPSYVGTLQHAFPARHPGSRRGHRQDGQSGGLGAAFSA